MEQRPAAEADVGLRALRRQAMTVLAHADREAIADRLRGIKPLPAHDRLREPEQGLVMIRGRTGGDGAPFNLGEATVTRAVLRLETGEVGFGYALGRDRAKAEMIALCDAMIQSADHATAVSTWVIKPLHESLMASRDRRAAETAATRVDFYTMVRGEG